MKLNVFLLLQQRDKKIEEEIAKLKHIELQRHRQAQILNLMKDNRNPINLLSTMMGGANDGATGEGSSTSRNDNP